MKNETKVENKDSQVEARHRKPIVRIQQHCWTKMYGWCRAAKSEVSGMGMARIEDGAFVVYDVFFPKQYCSSGWTELDDEHLSILQQKLFQNGRNMNEFRFWWHTHYNFSTFWSGQDESMAQALATCNTEWSLSLVINQMGDYKCRIDLKKPIDVTIDDIKVHVTLNDRKRKRKRNFKSDIHKWVHPMPVRVQPTTQSCTWTRDQLNKTKLVFKGTPFEQKVNAWIEKRLKKRSYYQVAPRMGPESLNNALGEGDGWENVGGVIRKVSPSQCPCMHSGEWSECFCLGECNICSEIQMGGVPSGESKAKEPIWPVDY